MSFPNEYRPVQRADDAWGPYMTSISMNGGARQRPGPVGRNQNWRPDNNLQSRNQQPQRLPRDLSKSPQLGNSGIPQFANDGQQRWNSQRSMNKKNVRKTYGLLDRVRLQPIPLREVHIKGQIIGPFSRMTVTQYYQNLEPTAIEAEYVFPLAKYATVCEFSAEIDNQKFVAEIVDNDKTLSYEDQLYMPQEWPMLEDSNQNIFKIPLGIVPPNAVVMTTITYVGELLLRENELTFSISNVLFPPPDSASRQENIEKGAWRRDVGQSWEPPGATSPRRFNCGVKMSLNVTMPIPIENIQSSQPTLKAFTPNNLTAVISLEEGTIIENDFDMSIRLVSPHTPQIYLETSADNQVVAFVLRPDFVGVNLFPDNTAFSEMIMDWSSLEVEQVPKTLRPISNMGCIIVYAVLQDVIIGKEDILLKAITVDGVLQYKATLNPSHSFEGNLLHQLVARRKVRELERLNQQQFSQERKNMIISLSLQHSITSQYTSFLVSEEIQDVDGEGQVKWKRQPLSRSVDIRPKGSRSHDSPRMSPSLSPSPGSPNMQNGWRSGSGGISRGQYNMGMGQNHLVNGGYPRDDNGMYSQYLFPIANKPGSPYPQHTSPMSSPRSSPNHHMMQQHQQQRGGYTPFGMSNGRNNHHQMYGYQNDRTFSPFSNANSLSIMEFSNPSPFSLSAPLDQSLKVRPESILSMQLPSGGWNLDHNLASLLGFQLDQLKIETPPEHHIFWATSLVIAWLDIMCADYFSIWEQQVEKAKVFMQQQKTDVEGWINHAAKFIEQTY